jgi:hypothetical protein
MPDIVATAVELAAELIFFIATNASDFSSQSAPE